MKKHRLRTASWILGLLSTLPLAGADLNKRLSVALADAPPEQVFGSLAGVLDADLELDPAVEGPVTITVERVTASTLLDAVCESIDCFWELREGEPTTLRVVAREVEASASGPGLLHEPIQISLAGADAGSVFRACAKILSLELAIDSGLGEVPVTIELGGPGAEPMTLAEALTAVCEEVGCAWELRPDGESPETLAVVR